MGHWITLFRKQAHNLVKIYLNVTKSAKVFESIRTDQSPGTEAIIPGSGSGTRNVDPTQAIVIGQSLNALG